jgi:hypothetical protein
MLVQGAHYKITANRLTNKLVCKNMVKIRNMTGNSGREIPNQFIIETDEGRYFQSYNSIIAFIPYNEGKTQLDEYYWNYSKTTGKYRNQFLGEDKKETEKAIKEGRYILTNLNK